jgi:energy-coupling factor transport system substrate-specific component
MQATANTGILIAMFAAVIITSAISAFVGCKMLKKQFEKAGITA